MANIKSLKGSLQVFILICSVLFFISCKDETDQESTSSDTLKVLTNADQNPGRGYYQWRGLQVVPPHKKEVADKDIYQRFYWKDLEKTKDNYDFSPITSLFASNPNSKVSFRIRSFYDYTGVWVPEYLQSAGWFRSEGNFVPDWNSEAYLDGVERLMNALKAALEPYKSRIGFIDIGMYGQYGEWYLRTKAVDNEPWVDYSKAPSGITEITFESKKRIVDAQLSAFPDASWVMFFLYEQRDVLEYVFYKQTITRKPVGWRFDGLGKKDFLYNQWQNNSAKLEYWNGTRCASEGTEAVDLKAFKNRWKTAPVVCEFYGAEADPDEALKQIKLYHIGMVSNGNFSSVSGADNIQWEAIPFSKKEKFIEIGRIAGWAFTQKLTGDYVVNDGNLQCHLQITNIGTAPVWRKLNLRLKLTWDEGNQEFEVEGDQGLDLLHPEASLTLDLKTINGSVPSGKAIAIEPILYVDGQIAYWSN